MQGKALRAGEISPTGAFLAPLGDVSFEELVDIYTEQAAGLERAGVDLFVIETMMTLSDARAAVLAVRSVSDKPIFVTFTCDENGRSVSGTDITAALVVLQGMGIDAFGLIRSAGPEQMLLQLKRLREYARVPHRQAQCRYAHYRERRDGLPLHRRGIHRPGAGIPGRRRGRVRRLLRHHRRAYRRPGPGTGRRGHHAAGAAAYGQAARRHGKAALPPACRCLLAHRHRPDRRRGGDAHRRAGQR